MDKRIAYFAKICVLIFTIPLIFSCEWNEPSLVGYIEGEFTYISSAVSGTLNKLAVMRGQEVKKGELLFLLDPEPEASSVKASKASIANLQSQVTFYHLQLTRQKSLFSNNATSKLELEKAQASYDSYVQQLAASQARLIQTQWSLDQKIVTAPVDGRVFDTYFVLGEKILAYKPALSILNPGNIQVIFYLPESQLSSVKLGQKISINCDGCKKNSEATVSYISPEAQYTPPLIYSKDTRESLVYLIRARMTEDVARNFHPGQPIDVRLNNE